MCGIGGVWLERPCRVDLAPLFHESQRERGPDFQGQERSLDESVRFFHQRLSILDLSESSHQPFCDEERTKMLCYNGEIYNFQALKKDFFGDGSSLKSSGDTEVLFRLLGEKEPFEVPRLLQGMFAYAYFDQRGQKLWLSRDRFGQKPLFYRLLPGGKGLAFASTVTPLRRLGELSELCENSMSELLLYSYIGEPRTVFKDIFQVPAGCTLCFEKEKGEWKISQDRYFDPVERAGEVRLKAARSRLDERELLEQAKEVLLEAVDARCLSDVPIGALLSGGIDSSLVCSLMAQCQSDPIETFTIGSSQGAFDESGYAKKVAYHLGARHHHFELGEQEMLDLVVDLPKYFDQPFADSSQLPMLLVCEMARKHVTVALSGDAGDEMFAGYARHLFIQRWGSLLMKAPLALRIAIGQLLRSIPWSFWERVEPLLRRWVRMPASKVQKLGACLASSDLKGLYQQLIRTDNYRVDESFDRFSSLLRPLEGDFSSLDRFLLWDTLGYMKDDILVKCDRSCMAHSLELRNPFLDHRVFEMAWGLPTSQRISMGKGKFLLRRMLEGYLPQELWERPKMGFAVPLNRWLKGPLKPLLLDFCSRPQDWPLEVIGHQECVGWIEDHLAGNYVAPTLLWNVLQLDLWLRSQAKVSPVSLD